MSQLNVLGQAYSDDGGHPRDRSNTEDLQGVRAFGPRDLPDIDASIRANISEHRNRNNAADHDTDDAIEERPDESENNSNPPGAFSIQDVRSENIDRGLGVHKFGRKPKQAQSVFRSEFSDDAVSREVHESQAIRQTFPEAIPEAQVSDRVILQETSRSIQTFKMTYERLFKKFQERLVQEYSGMRGGYMSEYQQNYDQNSTRREGRLIEMNMAIEGQTQYKNELARMQEQQQSCLNRFFAMKSNQFRLKTVLKAWKAYFAKYKSKARLAAYMRNTLHRKKMNRLFENWRGVTHKEFQVRMNHERITFRTQLESQVLVQWSTKVDALLLYVAELEDKIKQEQEARDKLALMYDQSLSVGYTRLTNETAQLAKNPLVHEVTVQECQVEDKITSTINAKQMEMLNRLREQYQHMNDISERDESQRDSGPVVGDENSQEHNLDRMTMHFRAQLSAEELEAQQRQAMHWPPTEAITSMSNHEISGIQNWYDLGDDQDCSLAYKNEHEVEADFQVTRSSVIELYEGQLQQLRMNPNSDRNIQVVHCETLGSLSEGQPTILERYRFVDGAGSINHFLKAILAQYKRKQWDRQINDLRLISPVVDKNFVIMEELSNEMIPGYQERECLVKRTIFRAHGCIFVYTSSVPDSVHCDEDSGRDDAARYTLVYSIMCFKRVGGDLILERIRQVDFRQAHSPHMMQSYLNTLEVKALYWQQDLLEKVAQEELHN